MGAAHTVIGLDIGRHSVKAAWVESRPGGPVVTRTETLHLPLGDRNPTRMLEPWIEQCGIRKHLCVVGLAAGDCVFQTISIQQEDPRSLAHVVAMEVAKFNDIASSDMRYGFRDAGAAEARRVLVVMAKPVQVEAALEAGTRRGLRIGELFPMPSAAAAAVAQYAAGQTGTTVVVELGHGGSCVTFCGPGGMLFARGLRTGGESFTEALREGYGLSPAQADVFKINKGRLDGDDAQIRERLGQVAELWCREVAGCVSAFRGHYPDETLRPERVVLAGGGSLLPGLSERLARELTLPAVSLATATSGALEERQAALFGAVGLGMAAARDGRGVVSLLPEYLRDELVFRRKKPLWISSGVILALALGVFFLSVVRAINQEGSRLGSLKAAVKERRALVSRINRLEQEIASYQDRTEPLMDLLTWGPRVREVVTLTAESLALQDWVSLICDVESYESVPLFVETPVESRPATRGAGGMRDKRLLTVPGRAPDAPPVDVPRTLPRQFVIEGYTPALDLSSVRELVVSLQMRADMIEAADLRFDDMVQPADWFRRYTAGAAYKRFSLGVTLRERE